MKTTVKINLAATTHVALGKGEWLCSHTTDFQGSPGLAFKPAKYGTGKVGDPPDPEEDLYHGKGSVLITFTNKQSLMDHLNMIQSMLEALQNEG